MRRISVCFVIVSTGSLILILREDAAHVVAHNRPGHTRNFNELDCLNSQVAEHWNAFLTEIGYVIKFSTDCAGAPSRLVIAFEFSAARRCRTCSTTKQCASSSLLGRTTT